MAESRSEKHDEAYAGRWVARLQGRIVGQGGTPTQARLAAGTSRHKEDPEISFIRPAIPVSLPPLVERVLPLLGQSEVYLVGGALRDMLIGRESHDFDFAVADHAIEVARRVARGLQADFYVLDEAYDAARVIVRPSDGPRDVLDFAAFRGADIEADLAGRDFTINAMAFDPATASILDPLGGGNDLRAKIIRACSGRAMQDDPVRILRAVRQAAALGFKLERATREAMKDAARFLPDVSPERQRDEVFRILDGPVPETALKALQLLGTLPYFLPELVPMKGVRQSPPHVFDVWDHTLAVIKHLTAIFTTLGPDSEAARNSEFFSGLLALRIGRFRQEIEKHFSRPLSPERSVRSLLFFAALYHDVSKPSTRSEDEDGRIHFLEHGNAAAAVVAERAGRYNLSNDELSRARTIVTNHMRFNGLAGRMQTEKEPPSRRAIYRFFRSTGEAGIDVVMLGLADQWGMREHTLDQASWEAAVEVARILLENYFQKPEESVRPVQLLDGREIMREYGIAPGPAVGALLEALREAQATGEVNDREQAVGFGHKWLKDNPG